MKPGWVAFVAAMTLVVGSCSSGTDETTETIKTTAASEPAPSAPAVTPPASASPRSKPGDDPAVDAYLLQFVAENVPNASLYATDEQIFAAAEAACSAMDDGMTMREYYAFMAGMDGTLEEKQVVASIVGASIGAYCPEHFEEG